MTRRAPGTPVSGLLRSRSPSNVAGFVMAVGVNPIHATVSPIGLRAEFSKPVFERLKSKLDSAPTVVIPSFVSRERASTLRSSEGAIFGGLSAWTRVPVTSVCCRAHLAVQTTARACHTRSKVIAGDDGLGATAAEADPNRFSTLRSISSHDYQSSKCPAREIEKRRHSKSLCLLGESNGYD